MGMGDRDRRSLRRFLLLYSAGVVVVLTALGGLLVWALTWTTPQDAPERGPFDSAVIALAAAPEVHYRSQVPSIGLVDVRVTNHDELVGMLSVGGQSFGLLRVGGTTYIKAPATGLPKAASPTEAAATKNRWVTGAGITRLLGPIPARFESPPLLAARLAGALSQARRFPALDDQGTVVDGVRVVRVSTSLGQFSVTKNAPHRVVRLTPPSGGGGIAALPAVTAYAETSPAGAMDFPPEQPGDIGRTYDALSADTRALASAVDSDLRFDLQGAGQVSCGDAGCQASVVVTNSVSAAAPNARVVGGAVTAVLNAAISIEGQAADGCTSTGSLPLNGTGTLSCADPGAGAVFASIEAEKRAAAEAQSRAEGGAPVPYSVAYRAEFSVYATAQVDVEQLVRTQRQEADDAARRVSCPPGVASVDPVLVAAVLCGDGNGPIGYNSDELSRAAFRARLKVGYDEGRNVAVARVPGWNDPKTGDLVYGFSRGEAHHSESEILDQLRARGFDASRITALYSERQPCGGCRALLEDRLTAGTPVSWSVPYGDNGTMNQAATELLKEMIRRARAAT